MKHSGRSHASHSLALIVLFLAFVASLFFHGASLSSPNARAQSLFAPPPALPSHPPTAMATPTLSFGPIYMPSVGHTFPAMGLCISTGTQRETARLVRVVDGDPIEVEISGQTKRVRYIGIDTPEYYEPYYLEAKEFNRSLVQGGALVLIKSVYQVALISPKTKIIATDGESALLREHFKCSTEMPIPFHL